MFGYHEMFHAMVILAGLRFEYAVVAFWALPGRPERPGGPFRLPRQAQRGDHAGVV